MGNSETSPAGNRPLAFAGFAIAIALVVNTLVMVWGLVRTNSLVELYNQAMVGTLPERAHQLATQTTPQDSFAVRVDLYSDFDCAFCRRSVAAVLAARRHFGDKVRWRYWYRANPVRPMSIRSALVAMCTEDGDGPWRLYSLLSDSVDLTDNRLAGAVESLGRPASEADKCVRADSTAQRLWRQMFLSAAAGRTRTPTVVVDGIEIAGLLTEDALISLIEDRLMRRRRQADVVDPVPVP
jgi:hypothetical protein